MSDDVAESSCSRWRAASIDFIMPHWQASRTTSAACAIDSHESRIVLNLYPAASSTVSPSSTASISSISLSGLHCNVQFSAQVVECWEVRAGMTKSTPRMRRRRKKDERLRQRNADSADFA